MASLQFSRGDMYNAYTGHYLNKDITEYQVETIEDFIEDGLVVAGECDGGDDNQQGNSQNLMTATRIFGRTNSKKCRQKSEKAAHVS